MKLRGISKLPISRTSLSTFLFQIYSLFSLSQFLETLYFQLLMSKYFAFPLLSYLMSHLSCNSLISISKTNLKYDYFFPFHYYHFWVSHNQFAIIPPCLLIDWLALIFNTILRHFFENINQPCHSPSQMLPKASHFRVSVKVLTDRC